MRLRLAPARRRRASERSACVQLAELAGPCCPEPLRPASLLVPCPSSCSPWPAAAALKRCCAADEEQTARRDSSAGSPLERSSVARPAHAARAASAHPLHRPEMRAGHQHRPPLPPPSQRILPPFPRSGTALGRRLLRAGCGGGEAGQIATRPSGARQARAGEGAAPAAHVTQSPAWSVRENCSLSLEGARRLHKAPQGSCLRLSSWTSVCRLAACACRGWQWRAGGELMRGMEAVRRRRRL